MTIDNLQIDKGLYFLETNKFEDLSYNMIKFHVISKTNVKNLLFQILSRIFHNYTNKNKSSKNINFIGLCQKTSIGYVFWKQQIYFVSFII